MDFTKILAQARKRQYDNVSYYMRCNVCGKMEEYVCILPMHLRECRIVGGTRGCRGGLELVRLHVQIDYDKK